jgi:hypothetical protein
MAQLQSLAMSKVEIAISPDHIDTWIMSNRCKIKNWMLALFPDTLYIFELWAARKYLSIFSERAGSCP